MSVSGVVSLSRICIRAKLWHYLCTILTCLELRLCVMFQFDAQQFDDQYLRIHLMMNNLMFFAVCRSALLWWIAVCPSCKDCLIIPPNINIQITLTPKPVTMLTSLCLFSIWIFKAESSAGLGGGETWKKVYYLEEI